MSTRTYRSSVGAAFSLLLYTSPAYAQITVADGATLTIANDATVFDASSLSDGFFTDVEDGATLELVAGGTLFADNISVRDGASVGGQGSIVAYEDAYFQGTLETVIKGEDAGRDFFTLDAGGILDVARSKVRVTLDPAYSPAPPQRYILLSSVDQRNTIATETLPGPGWSLEYANDFVTLVFAQVPLPVEWLSVAAFAKTTGTEVTWATASERNTDYYKIERSRDGETWAAAGQVAAAGTTAARSDYTYPDAAVERAGVWYYRVEQVDLDGTTDYSDVVSVEYRTEPTVLSVSPNPVQAQTLNLFGVDDARGPTRLRVIAADGRVLVEEGGTDGAWSDARGLPFLPVGIYAAEVAYADGTTAVASFAVTQ